jgi:phosphoserine phosphatase RsbU/P
MKKLKAPRTSLIKIADVLKSVEKLSTESQGTVRARVPNLEIAIRSVPAETSGGDFYGAIYLQQDRTGLFVGDIAGHDFHSSVSATVAMDFIENNQDALLTPDLFIGAMAQSLYHHLSSNGRFFTIAVCCINTERDTLSYASAGHPPALFYSRLRDRVDPVGRKSFPIGFEKEVEFTLVRREFLPGDLLMLYTDGISSARNRENEEFGTARLERILYDNRNDPVRTIGAVIDALQNFEYDDGHRDDQTIMLAARL